MGRLIPAGTGLGRVQAPHGRCRRRGVRWDHPRRGCERRGRRLRRVVTADRDEGPGVIRSLQHRGRARGSGAGRGRRAGRRRSARRGRPGARGAPAGGARRGRPASRGPRKRSLTRRVCGRSLVRVGRSGRVVRRICLAHLHDRRSIHPSPRYLARAPSPPLRSRCAVAGQEPGRAARTRVGPRRSGGFGGRASGISYYREQAMREAQPPSTSATVTPGGAAGILERRPGSRCPIRERCHRCLEWGRASGRPPEQAYGAPLYDASPRRRGACGDQAAESISGVRPADAAPGSRRTATRRR